MTANSQLLTTTPKTKTKANNQNRKEPWKWRSHGGLSAGEWEGREGGKVQGEVKNSIGNVEAKELICMTHGHELQGGNVGGRGCAGWRGREGGKWGN